MKKRSLLLSAVTAIGLTTVSIAQVPNYVQTNGLVGWWPFNGNANDESGNGNNGSFTGPSCIGCGNVTASPVVTSDRFSTSNSAYQFSDLFDLINIPNSSSLQVSNQFSISIWLNPNLGSYGQGPSYLTLLQKWGGTGSGASYMVALTPNGIPVLYTNNAISTTSLVGLNPISLNDWTLITFSFQNGISNLYINGVFSNSASNLVNPAIENSAIQIARNLNQFTNYAGDAFSGKIDDIGIWNRALSECEIQDLYNSQINSIVGSIIVSPQPASIGSNVTLSTATNSTNVQWQTNGVNLGWQNVPTNSSYIGGTTNTLTVNNIQLSNHNQPFRLIANSGSCSDTSNTATIQIADTCVTTIYDTLLTTVTDTLIINTTLSLPAPNNENTILIYPNPASDHITIDNGNFAAMVGYSIKITNNAGQEVFLNAINQQQFYVDLSTWTGNGLYFVHLIDSQNNTVTVRKIVLQ
jgi:hypothetical protein